MFLKSAFVLFPGAICVWFSCVESAEIRELRRLGAPDIQFAGPETIVGGHTANKSEVPWFVHFGDDSCGATLISQNRVLTAAHCVYTVGAPDTVRVGAFTESDGQSVAVTCAKVHPDYDPVKNVNDLAILKLASNVTNVPFVTLNSNTAYPSVAGQTLIAIGLGLTSANGQLASTLQEVDTQYVTDSSCASRIGYGVIQGAAHLCADVANKGVCNGDSGGPLVDTNFTQVGIVSFGIDTCASQYPDVYTQVSTYYDWIQGQLTDGSCDSLPVQPSLCGRISACCSAARKRAIAIAKSLFSLV